ncbi:MAG: MAPEG family protein [Burkholderiaceae bacterium]
MVWIELVTVLALLQLLGFGVLVGRARGKYGVQAPAVTGDPVFERYYRVQMNTLELLPALLVGLWLASRYWSPGWLAAIGALYLLGRLMYLKAYVRDPAGRGAGFGLSFLAAAVLLLLALAGIVRSVL